MQFIILSVDGTVINAEAISELMVQQDDGFVIEAFYKDGRRVTYPQVFASEEHCSRALRLIASNLALGANYITVDEEGEVIPHYAYSE